MKPRYSFVVPLRDDELDDAIDRLYCGRLLSLAERERIAAWMETKRVYTVPEALRRWIPCSERTPDVDGRLWAVLSDTVNCGNVTGYYPLYEYYHFDNGWATDERITHWLEVKLPAMPSIPSPLRQTP